MKPRPATLPDWLRDPLGMATLGYLALVLVAGGESAGEVLSTRALPVQGAGLAGWALAQPGASPTRLRPALLAGLVLALAQFVPLPPVIWAALPGRASVAQGFALLGQPVPWLPLGLAPWHALSALAAVIPALAIWLALRRPGAPLAQAAVLVVIIAAASVSLGLIQQFGQRLYTYRVTNYWLGPGWFANANHQSSFLLVALALWSATLPDPARRWRGWWLGWSLAVPALLMLGVLLNHSLACWGILPALGLMVTRIVFPGLPGARLTQVAFLALLAGATLVVLGPFGNDLTGHGVVPGISRHDFLRTGLALLRDNLPLGSGLGSFRGLYGWYEDPALASGIIVNHAHNDWLELLVETGLFGAALIALLLAGLAPLVRGAWQGGTALARAASLVVGVELLHSLVDYPLRTAALSAVFALACAMLEADETDRPSP